MNAVFLLLAVYASPLFGFRISEQTQPRLRSTAKNIKKDHTSNHEKNRDLAISRTTEITVSDICGNWEEFGGLVIGETKYEYSGSTVATSADGGTVAISAPYNGEEGNNHGAVRVYTYDNWSMTWMQLGQTIFGVDNDEYSGVAISFNRNGRTLAIGAPGSSNRNRGATRIYEYKWSSKSWIQKGGDILGALPNEMAGASISLSDNGDIVAIGSAGSIQQRSMRTKVFIFTWNWKQLGDDIMAESMVDHTGGVSLSMSGDGHILAVGAKMTDENGKNSGHVRIFSYNDETGIWNKKGNTLYGKESREFFGTSVSMSNDGIFLAIGADGYNHDTGYTRVYFYDNLLSEWMQVGEDLIGDVEGSFFGTSVSLSEYGNIVAVGAVGIDDEGEKTGHTKLFAYVSSLSKWTQLGQTIYGKDRNDYFGASVSISGDGHTIAVGSPFGGTGNQKYAGNTNIFQFNTVTCAPSVSPSSVPSAVPSSIPTTTPSSSPTHSPTSTPSISPSSAPTASPTHSPSSTPSISPSIVPTASFSPSNKPSNMPTLMPTNLPTSSPSAFPSESPSSQPSLTQFPSEAPSQKPSFKPSNLPSSMPSKSLTPSVQPSQEPSYQPSSTPSIAPSNEPSEAPSQKPSFKPSNLPSSIPSKSLTPSVQPSQEPSYQPSSTPSIAPSNEPTDSSHPSITPTTLPSLQPSEDPSSQPSPPPSTTPSSTPTVSQEPTLSIIPSAPPSSSPSFSPTNAPSDSTAWTFLCQVFNICD